MRMWMVNPRIMCSQHLLGEHYELHMLAGSITKGKDISGFLHGLAMPHHIKYRHDELVKEMILRGFKHQSPLEQPHLDPAVMGWVDIRDNIVELSRRCKWCRARMNLTPKR